MSGNRKPYVSRPSYRVPARLMVLVALLGLTAAIQATEVDWNIPENPAEQRRLCADYPAKPSAEDGDDNWDTPARRRIIACEALLDTENPEPDLYYYAGRLWLEIFFADRGRKMFRRGAEAGSTKAMVALGFWHWERRNDPETMLKYYKMAAERGDPVAQTELGLIYRGIAAYPTDEPLPEHPERGLELLRAAAEQGYPVAQYGLGMTTFQSSKEDEAARAKALNYIKAAARSGVLAARKNLEHHGDDVPELEDSIRYPTLWPRPLILDRP